MSKASSTVVSSGAKGRRRPVVRRRLLFVRGWQSWLVAALWALASTAWAAEPPSNVRYTRPPPKVRVANGNPKARVDAARKEVAEAPSGPSSAGAPLPQRRIDVELAAIDAQLDLLEALLQEASPNDDEYPDYLFRYASLQLDRKAIFEDQAGALYEEIHALKEQGKHEAAKRLVARQQRLRQQARAASESAVKAYALLVGNRPWAG
ncbi:hypothetical protein [Paraliomyxa miuraensis]|uniref:hypothetical protein n=1 Tax=Paraliomyxa miuraensis TaxID=376150 RepID=UPI002250C7B0|nr:hypothetical protein [Paraliomyxa miuraensis]MCX4246099.1 hypothetical protein [Paraliomyxa miuraensis]